VTIPTGVLVLTDPGRFLASVMTIPSALKLLVKVFPDPLAQAQAVGFFAGCGAVANSEHPTYRRTTLMVLLHSGRSCGWCNVCSMSILPLGLLVCSMRSFPSGSDLCFHDTITNRGDYRHS
jgi:hypothetical protein